MNLDYCFILAAGFGTRMGEIGKILPKVMWPLFEKNLLELQILYAKDLGFKKIYINIHHQKEFILDYFNSKEEYRDVVFLIEDNILDIGGGIHNFADKVGYRGLVYIINSDQFLLVKKDFLENIAKSMDKSVANLFLIKENSNNNYNEVAFDQNNKMLEIIKNNLLERNKVIWTYSGNSIINLNQLKRIPINKLNFFDVVANFKENHVGVTKLENIKYWDFGTKELYFKNMFEILKSNNNELKNFLIKTRSITLEKLKVNSYDTNQENTINMQEIGMTLIQNKNANQIKFQNIIQEIL